MTIAWFRRRPFDVALWLAVVVLLLSSCNALQTRRVVQPSPTGLSATETQRPAEVRVAPVPELGGAAPATPSGAVPPLPPPSADTVRVGLLLPLSGGNSGLGRSMLNAAQMALFDVADARFELVPYDTKSLADGAAEGARFAIGNGASLILGPLVAGSVRTVAPIARDANVPVIAFSSDRSVAGQGVYVVGFTPSAEVERVVSYARQRGSARFAVLAPDDAYGRTVADATAAQASALGGALTRVEYYDPNSKDLAEAVRRVARPERSRAGPAARPPNARGTPAGPDPARSDGGVPFDTLVLADGGARLRALAAYLPVYGINPQKVRILGTGAWDDLTTGSEPALMGAWFAAPLPDYRVEFAQRYEQVYGEKPARLATLAYDTVALAATLARGGDGPVFAVEKLTDPAGFVGRDGVFRLRGDGLAERGLAVLQVERQGVQVVSPPIRSFRGS